MSEASTTSRAQFDALPQGYIGGSVVSRLLDHPQAASFEIKALVRSKEKCSAFEKVGMQAVVGSLDELDKVEALASGADVIFSMVINIPKICAVERCLNTVLGRLGWVFYNESNLKGHQEKIQSDRQRTDLDSYCEALDSNNTQVLFAQIIKVRDRREVSASVQKSVVYLYSQRCRCRLLRWWKNDR